MFKKIFTLITLTIMVIAGAAFAAPDNSNFTEVASGRYKLQPKSAWLDAGMMPVNYSQVDWFLEVEVKSKLEPVRFDQPVKQRVAWEKVRVLILSELIGKNMLTRKEPGSSAAPLEFYRPKEWAYLIQQSLSYRFGSDVQFCKAQLVVRVKKLTPSGDLRWIEEETIKLNTGC